MEIEPVILAAIFYFNIVEEPAVEIKVKISIFSIWDTVKPSVATISPLRPVFQNAKRFRAKSIYLEPLVSDRDHV